MIDVLQKLLNDTKNGFEEYLKQNHRNDLLPRINELFDCDVKELNDEVYISLKYSNSLIFGKTYKLNSISDLDLDIRTSIKTIANNKIKFKLNIEYQDNSILQKDFDIEELRNLNISFKNYQQQIFNKIGIISVSLVHNKTKELVNFDIRISRILEIERELKNKENEIYNKYIEPRIRRNQDFYGEGDTFKSVVVDVLTGNFIVDEFDNFLSDENGNCISWQ